MALTLREGISVFGDLELTHTRLWQEEGQEKATEDPWDTFLLKIGRDNDAIAVENNIQQLSPSEEGEGKKLFSTVGETKSQSCKASENLSELCNESIEREYATPSEKTVVRNPQNLEFQATAQHQKKGDKEDFTCCFCIFNSDSSSRLRHHLKTHSDEKRYMCHLCPKAFHTATLLHNHVNTHTGTKPYKCSECDTAFVTRGELSRHRRYRHTLEKPFKCTACEYCSVEGKNAMSVVFASGTMKIHMLQKHGENVPKYQCPHCSIFISRKGDLGVHLKNFHSYVEEATECSACKAVFHERYTFLQHKKTHRGGKRFKRAQCGYTCNKDLNPLRKCCLPS